MEPLKISVIGAGNMGRNHIRILSEMKRNFCLQGFYDPSKDQTERIEQQFSIPSFQNVEMALEDVQAVVIAAPSSLHKEIALEAANRGIATLVEKPLAIRSEDANEIASAFAQKGCLLAVGHVERYNPVVTELAKLLRNERIITIEARRYSSFDGRISDANVVEDLMIHDIDLICNLLLPIPIRRLESMGIIQKSQRLDQVQSMVQFENGAMAVLGASRMTENKVREITVHTEESYITADLLSRTLFVTKNTNLIVGGGRESSYRQENMTQKIFVPMVEPLRAELEAFHEDIVEGREPAVNGRTAIHAIRICEEITKKAKTGF